VLTLDDRAGTVLTTIAVFAIVARVMYAVRATLEALVPASLLAYLLEPAARPSD
jgi:hypothetical protein